MSNIKYDILADDLTKQGHNVDKIRNNLKREHKRLKNAFIELRDSNIEKRK